MIISPPEAGVRIPPLTRLNVAVQRASIEAGKVRVGYTASQEPPSTLELNCSLYKARERRSGSRNPFRLVLYCRERVDEPDSRSAIGLPISDCDNAIVTVSVAVHLILSTRPRETSLLYVYDQLVNGLFLEWIRFSGESRTTSVCSDPSYDLFILRT